MKQKLGKSRAGTLLKSAEVIAGCITCLRQDLEALRDGTWVPDFDSVEASLQQLELLEYLIEEVTTCQGT